MALTFDKILGNDKVEPPVKPTAKVEADKTGSALISGLGGAPVIKKTAPTAKRGLGASKLSVPTSEAPKEEVALKVAPVKRGLGASQLVAPSTGTTSTVKAKSVAEFNEVKAGKGISGALNEAKDKPKRTSSKSAQSEIEHVYEDIDPAIVGSCSDKWEYVAAITDDSRADRNVVNDERADGAKTRIVNGKFIGYILRPLEDDMVYYETVIDNRYLKNLYTLDWSKVKEKRTKAGEEIIMTIMEAVALTARPEVNGYILGNGSLVMSAYMAPKGSGVQDLSTSGSKANDPDRFEWGGYLRPAPGGKTLKFLPLVTAISLDEKAMANTPQKGTRVQKKYIVHEGFERFAPAVDFSNRPTREELKAKAEALAKEKAGISDKVDAPVKPTRGVVAGTPLRTDMKVSDKSPEVLSKVSRNVQSAAFFKAWNAKRTK